MNLLPWYIAGPLIGLMVPLLLYVKEKQLGLSSTYRYFGSFILPKNSYFSYERKNDAWQVQFALGIVLASVLIFQFNVVDVSPMESSDLPEFPQVYSMKYWFLFLFGGMLIGFGSRYAGGCTAGHCIMGNSILSPASIIATFAFFIGGLIVSHFVLPYLI